MREGEEEGGREGGREGREGREGGEGGREGGEGGREGGREREREREREGAREREREREQRAESRESREQREQRERAERASREREREREREKERERESKSEADVPNIAIAEKSPRFKSQSAKCCGLRRQVIRKSQKIAENSLGREIESHHCRISTSQHSRDTWRQRTRHTKKHYVSQQGSLNQWEIPPLTIAPELITE